MSPVQIYFGFVIIIMIGKKLERMLRLFKAGKKDALIAEAVLLFLMVVIGIALFIFVSKIK